MTKGEFVDYMVKAVKKGDAQAVVRPKEDGMIVTVGSGGSTEEWEVTVNKRNA